MLETTSAAHAYYELIQYTYHPTISHGHLKKPKYNLTSDTEHLIPHIHHK